MIGIAALIYQVINYTTAENAIDIALFQVSADTAMNHPLQPVLGGIAVVGVIVVLVVGNKKK